MLSKFIIEQTEVEKLFNDIFLSDEAPEVNINYVDLHTVMIVSTLRYAIRYKLDYIANKDIAYMLNYVKQCVQLISSLKIVLINFRVNDKLVLRMQNQLHDIVKELRAHIEVCTPNYIEHLWSLHAKPSIPFGELWITILLGVKRKEDIIENNEGIITIKESLYSTFQALLLNKLDKTHMDLIHESKRLAYLLRHSHAPDLNGWMNMDTLVDKYYFDEQLVKQIVIKDDNGRFEFSKDKSSVRALYGHSIDVNLGLEPTMPPLVLYHGTAEKYVDSIMKEGLRPRKRNFVHLSETIDMAKQIGARHGSPVVLSIDIEAMIRAGYKFYKAQNGVWLTGDILPKFLKVDCYE